MEIDIEQFAIQLWHTYSHLFGYHALSFQEEPEDIKVLWRREAASIYGQLKKQGDEMTNINKKVKIISYESTLSMKWVGMVGTIIEENNLQCLVRFDGGETHCFFRNEFEEVK